MTLICLKKFSFFLESKILNESISGRSTNKWMIVRDVLLSVKLLEVLSEMIFYASIEELS